MLHSAGIHDCTPEVTANLRALLAPHASAPAYNPHDATQWVHIYTEAATLRSARQLRSQGAADQLGYTAETLRVLLAHPSLAKALAHFIAFSGELERRQGALRLYHA
eukprot:1031640-Amphidinium_carterae.1